METVLEQPELDAITAAMDAKIIRSVRHANRQSPSILLKSYVPRIGVEPT